MPDNITADQRRRAMKAASRQRDTGPEVALRRALRAAGLTGYRIDRRDLPGRPDVAWIGQRVAVFVDGAFWHGRPDKWWPGRSGEYWDVKIARNVERDRAVNRELEAAGWTVVRLWDDEVLRDPDGCVAQVRVALGR